MIFLVSLKFANGDAGLSHDNQPLTAAQRDIYEFGLNKLTSLYKKHGIDLTKVGSEEIDSVTLETANTFRHKAIYLAYNTLDESEKSKTQKS